LPFSFWVISLLHILFHISLEGFITHYYYHYTLTFSHSHYYYHYYDYYFQPLLHYFCHHWVTLHYYFHYYYFIIVHLRHYIIIMPFIITPLYSYCLLLHCRHISLYWRHYFSLYLAFHFINMTYIHRSIFIAYQIAFSLLPSLAINIFFSHRHSFHINTGIYTIATVIHTSSIVLSYQPHNNIYNNNFNNRISLSIHNTYTWFSHTDWYLIICHITEYYNIIANTLVCFITYLFHCINTQITHWIFVISIHTDISLAITLLHLLPLMIILLLLHIIIRLIMYFIHSLLLFNITYHCFSHFSYIITHCKTHTAIYISLH